MIVKLCKEIVNVAIFESNELSTTTNAKLKIERNKYMCNNVCNNRCRLMKSTTVSVVATNFVITVTEPIQLDNLVNYCLVIAQTLPINRGTLPVVLIVNGITYPLFSVSGNLVRADQLKCRKCYKLAFGNDPIHFSLSCKIKNTSFVVI